jgi:hypothetical protein
MAESKLQDLPERVRELVFKTLDTFVKHGPRGLAEEGIFPAEGVPVVEERCADFGGRFRVPPLNAPVYVYKTTSGYDLELPLWLEGADDRSDLFIFLEVDPGAGIARMVDLRAP